MVIQRNSRLLITGGTGSFGQSMLNRVLDKAFGEIVIFSRDEKKQFDLREKINNDKVKFVIGDVRDHEAVNRAFRGIDYVFHAAALKQVPSCEFFPDEAMKTNVGGTSNVINACVEQGVKTMVLLSTDKAVLPINAMGISKAMAEKLVSARAGEAADRGTVLCTTRYGNVMASRGSVIPLFIERIKEGKPLPITDIRMSRFLMSLSNAVDLVLKAFSDAKPGELLVQKAAAATIADLAEALITIATDSGVDYSERVEVRGIRPGEKLAEVLLTADERSRSFEDEEFFRVPSQLDMHSFREFFETLEKSKRDELSEFSSDSANRLSISEIVELLKSTPETNSLLSFYQ